MTGQAKLPIPIDAGRKDGTTPASKIVALRRLRAEANLVRFPFFDLTRPATGKPRDRIEVHETKIAPDGSKITTTWHVSRNIDSTFPGELARRLHREVVERLVSHLSRPVKNPVRLGSFREICGLLDIKYNGKAAKAIQAAFSSIVTASIESRTTLYSKAKKKYFDDTFHLYERVIVTGEELPDGQIADAVYVVLGSWYLENLNVNYVAPLDFEYFKQIQGSVASRMYELLHHWFFVSLRSHQPTLIRRYSTLCAYLPVARQNTLWKAKQQLESAHLQHYRSGYLLASPEWRPISGVRSDWSLVYTAGQKAQDEFRRNQSRRDQDAIAPDEFQPVARQLLLPVPERNSLSKLQQDLLRELELRGVTHGIALTLVEAYTPELIQEKLEAFDWQMNKADCSISQNPAGYLRSSIEGNYASPSGFVSREERARKAAEEAAQLQARKAAEARAQQDEQQKHSSLQALWAALPEPAQLALRDRALASLSDFARKCLQNEEREGRRGAGHATLEAEIHKLLEADAAAEKR